MRRRTVMLGAAAGAMLAAAGARGQQSRRQRRVGILSPLSGLARGPYLAAFRDQLGRHGFAEGSNLHLDVRTPPLGLRPAVEAARELVALKPDALFTCGTTLTRAALEATGSIPIVFTWVADPVLSGIVKDLNRPGANVTGATNRNFDLMPKRLEILRELLPKARRLAMVYGIFDPVLEVLIGIGEPVARKLELELLRVEVGMSWRSAMSQALARGADAAILLTPFHFFGMRLSMEDALQDSIEQRMPALYPEIETVEAGGLISYASGLADDMRRGAGLLSRVLKGDAPADLAIDQAARLQLAINLKAARAIGLEIPQSLLLRADRVIQ